MNPFAIECEESHAWGVRLGEVIDLALAALQRVAPETSFRGRCAVAEAIIESAEGGPDLIVWASVYTGAAKGSALYKAAQDGMEVVV